MESKKILIWTASYHPNIGGLENVAMQYANYMKKQGWDVHIITIRYPRSLTEREYLDGIKIFRYFFFHTPLNYIRNRRPDLFFAWFIMKPVTFIKLLIHFFRTRPDVVNLHFPDQQLFECYLLKLMFRFKLIISLHGNEVERMCILKKRTLRYYFYEKLFYSAEYITGCSKHLLDEFQKIFPQIESGKYFIIHNGVGELYLAQNVTENKINHIFTAARFVSKKGFELLIEAFQKKTDGVLLIAGGNKKELEKLGLEIKNGISLLGKLSPGEMATQLAESKMTIVPSIIEPYGIIVAEAICCGSPVVATNVGGIPEVIALAKKNLNSIEQVVFDMWVKIVDPEAASIRSGIDSVLKNYSGLEEYIHLIPNIRKQFYWSKRLDKYNNILSVS